MLTFVLLSLAAFLRPPISIANSGSRAVDLENAASRLEARWTGDSVRRAIELNFAASEAFQKLGDLTRAAQSLRSAALLQVIAGDHHNALQTLKRALAFNLDLPPVEAITTLTLYSRHLIYNSDVSAATLYVERARRLSSLTGDPAAKGFVFLGTGELSESRGDYAAAETDYLEAVRLFRQSDRPEFLARTLLLLAGATISLGKYAAGLEAADEAVGIFTAIGKGRDVALAQILRGHLLSLLGQKQEALDEYQNAESKFPADIDRNEKARLLAGIGYAYQDLGELRLSLVKRRQALAMFEREKNWTAVSYLLPILIDLNFKLDDAQAASSYLERSEELARRTKYGLGLAAAHSFVGDHYFAKRDDRLAIEYYGKALPVFERAKHTFMIATINDKLGSIYQRKGQNKRARRHFSIALALSGQMRNSVVEANVLFNLASLERDEGRTLEALRLSQASVDETEKLSASVRNSLLRTSHFASVSERYELHISLLMRAAETTGDRRYVRRALQAAERSRARSMLEKLSLMETDPASVASPELVAKEKELRNSLHAASENLANLLNNRADAVVIKRADEEIILLQFELEEVRAQLKKTNLAYAETKDPQAFDIEDFQKTVLDDRTVLLEFSVGEHESYAWVVDKYEVSGFRLPPRSELSSRIASLNSALRAREPEPGESIEEYGRRVAASEATYRAEARELSRQLLGPLSGKIEGKRLIVVADGPLHQLSFSALPFPGGERLVLDTNDVVYQPSAQTLSFVRKLPEGPQRSDRRELLVFSDPVFSPDDERIASKEPVSSAIDRSLVAGLRSVGSLTSLTRLRGSGREADAIVGAVGATSADLVAGFSANREAFLNADLRGYKMLHLATHAVSDTDRPERTGIVLSGFDENGAERDQVVRLQDVYTLKLQADLVVLSACETAAGKELRGEGLLSLNNAFIQAGSRAVLSTLWKVDDETTRLFMGRFYAGIADGYSALASLKRAQQYLRDDPRFGSPFYWAAFTLHGDPDVRTVISRRPRPWVQALIGLVSLVPGALLAAICRHRRKPMLTAERSS